jgi:hypothetical protein
MLPHQYMCARQRYLGALAPWRNQKSQIRKIFLIAIIIEILNKKELKNKNSPSAAGAAAPVVGQKFSKQIFRSSPTAASTPNSQQ